MVAVLDAVNRGLASNPRALGSFGSELFRGWTQQQVYEKEELRREIVQLRRSLETQNKLLGDEKTKSAVLTERLESELGNRHFRNGGISIGTALVSAGVFGGTVVGGYSWPLIVIGALVILVVWFVPFRRGKIFPTIGDEN